MLLYHGKGPLINITSRGLVFEARDSWCNSKWPCNLVTWPPSGPPSRQFGLMAQQKYTYKAGWLKTQPQCCFVAVFVSACVAFVHNRPAFCPFFGHGGLLNQHQGKAHIGAASALGTRSSCCIVLCWPCKARCASGGTTTAVATPPP